LNQKEAKGGVTIRSTREWRRWFGTGAVHLHGNFWQRRVRRSQEVSPPK
jgi:hypothetical protein